MTVPYKLFLTECYKFQRDSDNGEIQQLMDLGEADDYVCSVKFTGDGNYIAVGTPRGDVELWDVGAMKKV